MAPLVDWHMCGQDTAFLRGNKCNPSSSLNINSHFPEFHILSCPRSSGLYFKFSQFSSVQLLPLFIFLYLFSLIKNVRANELFINKIVKYALPDKN